MRESPESAMRGASWSSVRGPVEQIDLRPGMSLVLSDFAGSGAATYAHVESSDVAGIGFHLKGGARFETGGRAFQTAAGDVWAVRAQACEPSRFTLPEAGFRTAALRLQPEVADDLLTGLLPGTVSTTVRLPGLDAPSRRAVLQMFAAPYAGAARRLFLESRALDLLAAQIAAMQTAVQTACSDRDARHVAEAMAHLDAHLADPPTIAALARHVGTNDYTLKLRFRQITGTTIFGYVRSQRMQQAARELDAGRSVQEAAWAVGYCCPRSFAQAFRREFGALPGRHAARNSRAPR